MSIPAEFLLLEQPKNADKVRERVLSDDELRAVLKAVTFQGYDAAIRMMLLTCARREEVCSAEFSEFDLLNLRWVIPGSKRKNGQELVVPLPIEAARLVGTMGPDMWGLKIAGQSGNWDRYQKRLFERTGTSGWHRHDLRRTGATIMGSLGVQPHVIEVALGHVYAHSQLASVYNKSRYESEHREAIRLLSNYYSKLTV